MQSHLPTKVEVKVEDELGKKVVQKLWTKVINKSFEHFLLILAVNISCEHQLFISASNIWCYIICHVAGNTLCYMSCSW